MSGWALCFQFCTSIPRREGGPPKGTVCTVKYKTCDKNSNSAKMVVTIEKCATKHKMHICRVRNNSRIQSKSKMHHESTRMHHVKVAQRCVVPKGTNPPKRKVSEQSKDAVSEQQNAPCKCNNEYVATKTQGHSRYTREDSSKSPQTLYAILLSFFGFDSHRNLQYTASRLVVSRNIVAKHCLTWRRW